MSEQETPRRRMPLVPGPPGAHATPYAPQGAILAREPALRPSLLVSVPVGKIAKAISGVMAEVGTIKKGGHNDFFNYDYARFEDLLVAITPLMGKFGLAVLQDEIEVKMIEGNRVAVKYEFTVIHESGESLPPKHFTGMALARSRKGDFDDKSINKCHSAARKYFLLSLFQVPAGDFDDADADEKSDANQRRAVPGPEQSKSISEKAVELREAAPVGDEEKTQEGIPHRLAMPAGMTADQWANRYINTIKKARSREEIDTWDKFNDDVLQRLSDRYSTIYEMIATACQHRLEQIEPAGMPSPEVDPNETMNWVAAQLQQMATYQAAESFWNTVVAPRENEFERLDWEMLMEEWRRAESRLAPPQA